VTVARVSPDGQWILNLSFDDTQERHKRRVLRMPLEGGSAKEILTGDRIVGLTCADNPGAACIVNERTGDLLTVSVLDPIRGRGAKILMARATGDATISPDGKHVAFILPGKPQNQIRIASLRGSTEHEITATEAQDLESLDWSADGVTFFGGDMRSGGAHLLHIHPNGRSEILWTPPTRDQIWGIPSPDGRYLATFGYEVNSNAWIVPNP
jgi:Tol biopolymer transport system component